VREDVLDDFATIELARDAYGVVSPTRDAEIDDVATARGGDGRGEERDSSLRNLPARPCRKQP
jgi:hypothetical protein